MLVIISIIATLAIIGLIAYSREYSKLQDKNEQLATAHSKAVLHLEKDKEFWQDLYHRSSTQKSQLDTIVFATYGNIDTDTLHEICEKKIQKDKKKEAKKAFKEAKGGL